MTDRLKHLLITLALTATGAHAMNHNLAWKWGDTCSPPQTPYLAFHSPQSENLLFSSGKTIELRCQAGLRSVALTWSLHRNVFTTPFRRGRAESLPANRFVIRLDTAGLHPGFYDLRVELDTGTTNKSRDRLQQRPVKGVCTFGWQVDKMAVADTRPADFTAFWDKAKAKLASIPVDANHGPMQTYGPKEINEYNVTGACLPADYDPDGHRCETVESCKVDIAGPDGGRVYGWLARPKADGRFPAMLVLPGAGFAARSRPLEHARHGYVALDIQVHGQDVDLKKYPRLPGYNDGQQYEPPAAYYFYNIHLRCLQAVNYLLSRPDVDPNRIVVCGGSQGGRLSIVTAGLDPRIKAAVPCIAHFANEPYRRWAAACNAKKSDGMDVNGAPPVIDDAEARCTAYFDNMNFAPDIHCPVMMNGGLIDPVSPPYGVWAAFNRLGTTNKVIVPIDGHGHDWSAEFDRRAWRWLDSVLGN